MDLLFEIFDIVLAGYLFKLMLSAQFLFEFFLVGRLFYLRICLSLRRRRAHIHLLGSSSSRWHLLTMNTLDVSDALF